jgi:hypothetical protein
MPQRDGGHDQGGADQAVGDAAQAQQPQEGSVAQQVDGHAGAQGRCLVPVQRLEGVLGAGVVAGEIEPPQVVGNAEGQHGDEDFADAQVDAVEAGADREDRLADRDDDDQAVAFGEMAGRDRVHLDFVQVAAGDLEPNNQPYRPNASGMASAISRKPAMPVSSRVRRVVLSGATALVSQA